MTLEKEKVKIMSFAEKLKEARKQAGLSQEQLAEKLSVSRSAVAKWESDRGMPDVGNLKTISQLLSVSIDYLLDEDEKLCFDEIREPIDLNTFEKTGKCRDRRDAAVYAKFRDAESIYPLIRRKKLNRGEFLLDLFTSWGVSQLADYADNTDSYYLVEKAGRQYLVRVSEDFLTVAQLTQKRDPKKFTAGRYIFRKAACRLI